MINNDDFLTKIVQCPNCKQDVVNGERIWLEGQCLCPQCYQHFKYKQEQRYKTTTSNHT